LLTYPEADLCLRLLVFYFRP